MDLHGSNLWKGMGAAMASMTPSELYNHQMRDLLKQYLPTQGVLQQQRNMSVTGTGVLLGAFPGSFANMSAWEPRKPATPSQVKKTTNECEDQMAYHRMVLQQWNCKQRK